MTDTRNKIHFSDSENVFVILSFSRPKEDLETLFSPYTSLNSEQVAEHRATCNSTVSEIYT